MSLTAVIVIAAATAPPPNTAGQRPTAIKFKFQQVKFTIFFRSFVRSERERMCLCALLTLFVHCSSYWRRNTTNKTKKRCNTSCVREKKYKIKKTGFLYWYVSFNSVNRTYRLLPLESEREKEEDQIDPFCRQSIVVVVVKMISTTFECVKFYFILLQNNVVSPVTKTSHDYFHVNIRSVSLFPIVMGSSRNQFGSATSESSQSSVRLQLSKLYTSKYAQFNFNTKTTAKNEWIVSRRLQASRSIAYEIRNPNRPTVCECLYVKVSHNEHEEMQGHFHLKYFCIKNEHTDTGTDPMTVLHTTRTMLFWWMKAMITVSVCLWRSTLSQYISHLCLMCTVHSCDLQMHVVVRWTRWKLVLVANVLVASSNRIPDRMSVCTRRFPIIAKKRRRQQWMNRHNNITIRASFLLFGLIVSL